MNYSNLLENKIAEIKAKGEKPRLLLHACCAPCSSYVLEYLREHFDITLYFYNPNISPEKEYIFRQAELIRLVGEMGLPITVITEKYSPEEFFEVSKGLEKEPEGGERCFKCYRLRLLKTAEYAKKNGFQFFTTTLSISPYKNAEKLNEIGAIEDFIDKTVAVEQGDTKKSVVVEAEIIVVNAMTHLYMTTTLS